MQLENTGCLRRNYQLLYKLCNYKNKYTLVTVTLPLRGNNEPATLTTFHCFLSAGMQVCLQLNTNWQRQPINVAVLAQRLHLLSCNPAHSSVSHKHFGQHRAEVLINIYKKLNKATWPPLNILSNKAEREQAGSFALDVDKTDIRTLNWYVQ